jgi:hypothetical protein
LPAGPLNDPSVDEQQLQVVEMAVEGFDRADIRMQLRENRRF